jgi:transcriptional regulator with XRE-family HTH domain
MAWPSFEASSVDARTARGFALIGESVRCRRRRLGISQRQLEQLCGIDQSVISRLESGRLTGLRWSRFARLVEAMGGLGAGDPLPGWTERFMPPGRRGGRDRHR